MYTNKEKGLPSVAKQGADFLGLERCTLEDLQLLLQRSHLYKQGREKGMGRHHLAGKQIVLLFDKPSTRTRVSFEIAVREMGGQVTFLSTLTSQWGRGEPVQDTARVLSRYCHGIVMRTHRQVELESFAKWSSVPVINGLTNEYHPCQLVADLMTVQEHKDLHQCVFAWIGDGNNMAHSWIQACAVLGLTLKIAVPNKFSPCPSVLAIAQRRMSGAGSISFCESPEEAIADADVISTDVWASMGQEKQAEDKNKAFRGFTVTEQLLAKAKSDAIVLHCLPAHRGEEITEAVLEGPQSKVWDQAENRLYAHKAILEYCLRD